MIPSNFETIKKLMEERNAIEQELLSFIHLEDVQTKDASNTVRMIFQVEPIVYEVGYFPNEQHFLNNCDDPYITVFIQKHIAVLQNRLTEYDKILKPL